MTKRACALLFPLLAIAGAAAAQNSSPATRNERLQEHLRNAERNRMQWEARHTCFGPAIPSRNNDPEARPIHVDNQPALTLPKLRREWLQPSGELAAPDTDEVTPPIDDHASGFLQKRK